MSSMSVPIYGNYYGFVIPLLSDTILNILITCRYYTKRPFVTDERLSLLPLNLFQGARVLDVGCNEGWVTCEVGEYTTTVLFHVITSVNSAVSRRPSRPRGRYRRYSHTSCLAKEAYGLVSANPFASSSRY